MTEQVAVDVVDWLMQIEISDKNYRYVDLWDIEDCFLVEIGEHCDHLNNTSLVCEVTGHYDSIGRTDES